MIHRIHPAWWVLALTFAVLFSLNGSRASFAVLYVPLEEEAGWSTVSIAGSAMVGQVVMGVSFIVAGMAVDRYGPRRVLPIFALLHLAGYGLSAVATDVWQVYVGFGLLGSVAFGIGVGPLLAIVARWFHRHRGLALGIGSSAGQAGAALFAPMTALLTDAIGWRWTFGLLGFIPFALIFIAAGFLHRRPEEGGQIPYGSASSAGGGIGPQAALSPPFGPAIRQALRQQALWLACIVYFSANISTGLLIFHIVRHGQGEGLSLAAASGLLSVVTGVSVAGRVGGGAIADRTDFGKFLTISCVVMGVGVGLFATFPHTTLLYCFAAIYGVGLGGAVVLQTIVSRAIVGEQILGTTVGIILLAVNLGAGLGAFLGGVTFEWTDSYLTSFLIGAGGAGVAALSALALSSQLRRV